MRTLRLARIAAEAEGLRLRRLAQRTVIRLAIGLIALFFLCCTCAALHVAVWFWLRDTIGWQASIAGLAMAGFDLVVALVLLLIAMRSSPGQVEREALEVRRRAWENATESLSVSAMLLPVLRLALELLRQKKER